MLFRSIKGMAHITGGGFIENIPRMFSREGLTAIVNTKSYELPSIFNKIIEKGVEKSHMYNTFNMGIGFVLCIDAGDKDIVLETLKALGEEPVELGHIVAGGEGICLK